MVSSAVLAAPPDSFRFIVLGDRTGESQPGIFQQVWSEAARLDPAQLPTGSDRPWVSRSADGLLVLKP